MSFSPKETGEKLAAVLQAWKDLRPAKTFAGMTLAQFTAKVQPSLDARGADGGGGLERRSLRGTSKPQRNNAAKIFLPPNIQMAAASAM